jgi:hypothetical protein
MKTLCIAITILWNCLFGVNKDDKLVSTNKQEFESGKAELTLIKDVKVRKSNGVLYLPNCKGLKDNKSDDDFYELNYIGDLSNAFSRKVVKKTLYNGYEYLIIDTRNHCKQTTLIGKPPRFSIIHYQLQ